MLKSFFKKASSVPAIPSTNEAHIAKCKQYVCQNYGSYPAVMEKGERIYMWDVEGKKYMDFMSGYGSTNQGHCHPEIKKAAIEQMEKITQISRAYHNVEMGKFGEMISNLSGYDKFFPSNGGCEACETAVKFARRWGYRVKGVEADKAEIIMANENFWGRSITASGACNDPSRYTDFGPFTPGFPLVDYNNLEAIEKRLQSSPNAVGVYLEPIQGEGGILMPDNGYLAKVKALCKKYNVLLIADEVQTGFGRTGYMFGYEHDMGKDDKPDILVFAKSASGGFYPVSGILADAHIMDLIKAGEHGSTFGGNPLGMAIAKRAVEVIVEEKMVENSAKMGEYLLSKTKTLSSPLLQEVRGRGLFQGIEVKAGLHVDGNDLSKIMFTNGVLTKATHDLTVRLSPALVINKEEIDAAMTIIEKSMVQLEELNEERSKK